MTGQWTRPNSQTLAMMRQCTGCVRASVQYLPPSVQKTGMPLLRCFFVHSAALTRINTGPSLVYTPVHCDHLCTHVCEQGVYDRLYTLSPAKTGRKGV
jgi:hypothetical protein